MKPGDIDVQPTLYPCDTTSPGLLGVLDPP